MQKKHLYSEHNAKLTLQTSNTKMPLNWLFIPGGPGADSIYLTELLSLIDPPGNSWLLDMPGNGMHNAEFESFDEWFDIFPKVIRQFENTVVVGHSFGAMLPLLYSECEEVLKGFVILNSSPCIWLEAAVKHAKARNLPDLSKEMEEFTKNPNQATFDEALKACIPYYFPENSMKVGRKKLMEIPFSYKPAVWWQRKAAEINYNAKWIPQNVPTVIISGELDAIVPYTLFSEDSRFDRKNITREIIKGVGHFPWIEKPEEIKRIFDDFIPTLQVESR